MTNPGSDLFWLLFLQNFSHAWFDDNHPFPIEVWKDSTTWQVFNALSTAINNFTTQK